MKNKQIKNWYKNSIKHHEKFLSIANYIGEKYITPLDGEELTKENMATIAMFSAMDMYIGSESTKKKFIGAGVAIGVIGTIVAIMVLKELKKGENHYDENY